MDRFRTDPRKALRWGGGAVGPFSSIVQERRFLRLICGQARAGRESSCRFRRFLVFAHCFCARLRWRNAWQQAIPRSFMGMSPLAVNGARGLAPRSGAARNWNCLRGQGPVRFCPPAVCHGFGFKPFRNRFFPAVYRLRFGEGAPVVSCTSAARPRFVTLCGFGDNAHPWPRSRGHSTRRDG